MGWVTTTFAMWIASWMRASCSALSHISSPYCTPIDTGQGAYLGKHDAARGASLQLLFSWVCVEGVWLNELMFGPGDLYRVSHVEARAPQPRRANPPPTWNRCWL